MSPSIDELIRRGLSGKPKRLPAALLYDDLGSALFEAITLLPEYQVARVDTALLSAHAGEALARVGGPVELLELGPGHGKKARIVLERVLKTQQRARFHAVDVSAAALAGCGRAVDDLAGVDFSPIEGTFLEGLKRAPARQSGHRRLVLFLGSNLSNFDRVEAQQFITAIHDALRPGDALLISADLEKDERLLLPAYDDALGVTAAFQLNVLVRLNREYGASFEPAGFAHEARWNAPARRIEMHLRALKPMWVEVRELKLELELEHDETLWTESSHRFNVPELQGWAREAGFGTQHVWVADAWPLALNLFTIT
ncbi:MAG: L-histidine N(alpha)-methyltransferase [Myxococcaceae bacterium]|nr:L-histidine N(alpha)-methyltransferase [Myxococcaceae bacterium]